mgnify:CR=1 FL=1
MRHVWVVLALFAAVLTVSGCGASESDADLVVYCAHDEVYAREVFDAFEKNTGIRVRVKYDTEATKSLGLTEAIIAEAGDPRCDVFWNNQLLGTVELKERGLLEPYQGPGFARIPEAHKDPQGHYVGFAARLRVYALNYETWPAAKLDESERDAAIEAVLNGNDLSRVAIARPLYGTTLSHYAVLWHVMGEEKMKAWHQSWRQRGVIERGGNATTRDLVAQGVCDIGLTDTDDFFMGRDAGHPITMAPIYITDEAGRRRTICIPNTVAIIRGCKNSDNARRFVDFLLSEEVEILLANSAARQVPLGPVDESRLNDDVRLLRRWIEDAYPLTGLHAARMACLEWLKAEYVR